LEKRGEKEIADLSEVEVVQMGHVMQPYIGKIFRTRQALALEISTYLESIRLSSGFGRIPILSLPMAGSLKSRTTTLRLSTSTLSLTLNSDYLLLTLYNAYTRQRSLEYLMSILPYCSVVNGFAIGGSMSTMQ